MRWISVLFAFVLTACGGRVANPVALERSFDDQLSCSHYVGELENNIKRLSELTGESNDKARDNLGLLISSPLFLDFSTTQKDEAAAILARNERLRELMAAKDCVLEEAVAAAGDVDPESTNNVAAEE